MFTKNIIATIFIVALVILVSLMVVLKPGVAHFSEHEVKSLNTTLEPLKEEVTENAIRAYQVIISSGIGGFSNRTEQSQLRFKFALKTAQVAEHEDAGQLTLLGQLYDFENPQLLAALKQSGAQLLPEQLAFVVQYAEGNFHSIDLLGLPAEHPYQIIETTLKQFSYHKSQTLALSLADGDYQYQYRVTGKSVKREMLAKHNHLPLEQGVELISEQQDWRATTDSSGFQQRLQFNSSRELAYDQQTLLIEQTINIDRHAATDEFNYDMVRYVANANRGYGFDYATLNQPLTIETDKQFLATLNDMQASPSLSMAKSLGRYAAQQGGTAYVIDLLLTDVLTDQQKSLLIFSLEQAAVEEAEGVLAEIILDASIDETNRLRAITSIAKLGQFNSQLSLDALVQLTRGENNTLADTALLNIGIMGRQAEHLSADIGSFLTERLQTDSLSNQYTDLLAINNLQSSEYNQQIERFLASNNYDERMLASRILSRTDSYQPLLMQHLLTENDPNVVNEIVNRVLSDENWTLSAQELALIADRAQQVELPVLKRLLGSLLNSTDQG